MQNFGVSRQNFTLFQNHWSQVVFDSDQRGALGYHTITDLDIRGMYTLHTGRGPLSHER
jgi:hypothetical protein